MKQILGYRLEISIQKQTQVNTTKANQNTQQEKLHRGGVNPVHFHVVLQQEFLSIQERQPLRLQKRNQTQIQGVKEQDGHRS